MQGIPYARHIPIRPFFESPMTHPSDPKHNATPEEVLEDAVHAAENEGMPEANPAAPAPEAVISALNAENASLKDQLLRTLADMENLRRRTAREVADAKSYAVTNFARDMLNVADNIRRAQDAIPEPDRASAAGAFKALIEGVELTEKDLLAILARFGVKKLDPQGAKFDPNMHQAMFEIPNADVFSGTVLQVVQTGYAIGDRVLRPAMVGVSKGGPKASATANDTAA